MDALPLYQTPSVLSYPLKLGKKYYLRTYFVCSLFVILVLGLQLNFRSNFIEFDQLSLAEHYSFLRIYKNCSYFSFVLL